MRLSSLSGKIVLVLIIALVPLIGHIAATLLIVRKPGQQKVLWLLVVWLLPFGPDIYLIGQLFGWSWQNKRWRWIIPTTLLLVIVCILGLFALGN